MTKYLLIAIVLLSSVASLEAQNENPRKLSITFQSGLSMGRWVYDKGMSEENGGFHQGYDRSHLAVYIPLGLQLTYNWRKWSLGVESNISWFSDDELISSTSKPVVPREYFLTDGSDIQFRSLSLLLERKLIDRPRYKMMAVVYVGTFRSKQDHPRESFFGRHYLVDLGLSNQIYLSKDWFVIIRPSFRRKHIGNQDSPFPGESHEIISFGLDYGFGFNLF